MKKRIVLSNLYVIRDFCNKTRKMWIFFRETLDWTVSQRFKTKYSWAQFGKITPNLAKNR